jgi:hypothetical protein
MGVRGCKWLKGKQDAVRFKPAILWNYISTLTQPFVKNNPKYAYQILAVKEMKCA